MTRDLAGQRFGRLVVQHRVPKRPGSRCVRWLCLCDCGQSKEADSGDLVRGNVSSCTCLQREKASARSATHRASRTTEFRIWQGMKQRCNDPNFKFYSRYGGRGIRVCQEWVGSFERFLADMGYRPSISHSLERNDNSGNYEPSNCRWATRVEQANNRRNTLYVSYEGVTMPLADAVRKSGSAVSINTAYARIVQLGWPVDRALTQPKQYQSPKIRRKVA